MTVLIHMAFGLLATLQPVDKDPKGLEEIPNFPSVSPSTACVCVSRILTHCEIQGNSIGSASSMSNASSAQWAIHWEQWCWQWMVIMDYQSTHNLPYVWFNCIESSGAFWVAWITLCKCIKIKQSEWRMDFPEWCFHCCWEEGRVDRQPSLSLINKPQRWSRGMPLFDKQEGHCLRISTLVVKRPERGDVRRVTDTGHWMEDVP